MRIERISNNQIRCTLTSVDLGARNLNLNELAYGSDSARMLFREMLARASYEVGFQTDNYPLMVEAIPMSNDSILIIVTKVEDPEEVDTRFARFAPPIMDEGFSFDMKGLDVLEGALDLSNKETRSGQGSSVRAFSFDSLDHFMEGAKAVGPGYKGHNTLYKNTKYYLLMENDGALPLEFASACNILSEYGKKLPTTYSTQSYYNEHYEVMIKDHAIQSMASV